jgi:hypothetical protein
LPLQSASPATALAAAAAKPFGGLDMTARRSVLKTMGLSALSVLVAVRLYGELVPWGAGLAPFALARVDGPVLTSPDGSRRIHVYFNDGGATHSGNHWTWFVEHDWMLGRVVVLEGYVGRDVAVSGEPVPATWSHGNRLAVAFLPSR